MIRRSEPTSAGVGPVLALGAVSVLGAAWFAWSLPAAPSRRARPGAALAEDVGPWRWAYDALAPPSSPSGLATSLLAVSAVMFAAWSAAIVVTWRRPTPGRLRVVVGCVAVASAISVVALPSQSSDIYDYALFGRVAAANGGEPYHDLPDAYPDDPLYRYSSHQYTGHPDNKLPVWTLLATGVADVAGDHPLVVLLGFRSLLAAATVLGTVLVARLAERLRAGAGASAAAIYGLCPVTLVYGGAKTDAVMVLLMVAGLALVADGRARAGTVATTLAVMVKAIAAPVLALVVLGPSEPDGPGPAGRSTSMTVRAMIAATIGVAAYLPFRDPLGLVRDHVAEPDETSAASIGVTVALIGLLALVVAAVARAWMRGPTSAVARAEALVAGAAPLLVVFAVALTRPGLPWYLLTPLAVVALARSVPLLVLSGALAATSFVMGWWDSIDTAVHPLPEVHGDRATLYLLVALGVAVVLVALGVRGRGRAPGAPRRTAVVSSDPCTSDRSGRSEVPVTKRIGPIFGGDPPPDAPQVMWVGDTTTADEVAARVPGAVGFVDLDSTEVDVVDGTLAGDELAVRVRSILARPRPSRAGG